MKTLILDYSTWRCGGDGPHKVGEGVTALLNKEGFYCCLGQFSPQLNFYIKEKDMLDVGIPDDLGVCVQDLAYEVEDEHGDTGNYRSTTLTEEAISINDTTSSSPNEKITQLKDLFSKYDYDIQVINQP